MIPVHTPNLGHPEAVFLFSGARSGGRTFVWTRFRSDEVPQYRFDSNSLIGGPVGTPGGTVVMTNARYSTILIVYGWRVDGPKPRRRGTLGLAVRRLFFVDVGRLRRVRFPINTTVLVPL